MSVRRSRARRIVFASGAKRTDNWPVRACQMATSVAANSRCYPVAITLLLRRFNRLLCYFCGDIAQFGSHDVAEARVPAFDERGLDRCAGGFVRMFFAAFDDSRCGCL